jgi:hypothetical protein
VTETGDRVVERSRVFPVHRLQVSYTLLTLQAVAAVVHAVPGLVYANRVGRTTTRVVAYIQDLGPVWVAAFGLSALLLAGALLRRRYVHYGHLACASVWVMYAVALWTGALLDTPHGTIFYPILASVVVVLHVVLASSYNDDVRGRA